MVKSKKIQGIKNPNLEKHLRLSIYNLIDVTTEMVNSDELGESEELDFITETIENLDNLYRKLYPNEHSPIISVIVS